jgi:hypothetical protein
MSRDDVHEVLGHDLFRFTAYLSGTLDSTATAAMLAQRYAEQTPAGIEITRFVPVQSTL